MGVSPAYPNPDDGSDKSNAAPSILESQQTQVIEDAKRVCIARDKAKSELAAIKQQAEKDKAEFEVRRSNLKETCCCYVCPKYYHEQIRVIPSRQREWKELGRVIEEDRRLRDALKRKIQDTAAQQRQQQQQQQQQYSAQQQQQQQVQSTPPSFSSSKGGGKDQQQLQLRGGSPVPPSSSSSSMSPTPAHGLLKVPNALIPHTSIPSTHHHQPLGPTPTKPRTG